MRLDTARSIYGADGDPLAYPSERPDDPYLLHGDTAHRLRWTWTPEDVTLPDGQHLEEFLRNTGAAPIGDRVVQVAFGANRDLTNLAWKFANYGQDVSRTLIALPGYVTDAEVVACNIGYWGYVYAALAVHRPPALNRPYLAGSRTPVTVLLLDEPQMAAMHRSEGVPEPGAVDRQHVSCDLSTIEVDTCGARLTAQLYGLPLPFLSLDDGAHPVAFRAVNTQHASTDVPRLTQRQLWDAITQYLGVTRSDVVNTIRAGAHTRMSGGTGSADDAQYLYETIRHGITQHLPVIDPDGTPATGTKGLPAVDPWVFTPLLRDQLR